MYKTVKFYSVFDKSIVILGIAFSVLVDLECLFMAVPKRKTSPSKRGMRRSADALKAPTYIEDKNSGELRRPHHVDLKTGMYRGRVVLTPKD